MAIIKNTIGKEIYGKLDGFTVYQRLGQTIIRSIAGVRPTGAGQLAQQERLKGCTTFYKAVRAAGLSPYWKQVEKLPAKMLNSLFDTKIIINQWYYFLKICWRYFNLITNATCAKYYCVKIFSS